MKSKTIRHQYPHRFEEELQEALEDGWEVQPGTMMSEYEPGRTYGVFMCVVQREESSESYDPSYGDGKVCKCGHAYYRHFDTYEQMDPCGCKYCDAEQCPGFELATEVYATDKERHVLECLVAGWKEAGSPINEPIIFADVWGLLDKLGVKHDSKDIK